MRPLKFIISGGGTGGHIFPAIAIANALKELKPDAEFLFVGAKDRMEMEKVPAAGYKIEGLWISGIQRRLTLKNLMFPFKLISSLMKSRKIIKKFKPDVVVGVGGFASGPLLNAANGMGIPTLIQEQNSYPGITNKLLAGKVKKICVAYDNMERFFPKSKIVMTGNPVRKELTKVQGKRERGAEQFGMDPNKLTILVIGGSLGARTINQAIEKSLPFISEQDVQLIWQTGKGYINQAEQAVKATGNNKLKATAFIDRMDLAYAMADVVVSRAGALSISELCLLEKASILIPSPNVAEDHQTKNAMALVNHGAAKLVKDSEALEKLEGELKGLIDDEELRKSLQTKIKALAFNNAADVIANEVIGLVKT